MAIIQNETSVSQQEYPYSGNIEQGAKALVFTAAAAVAFLILATQLADAQSGQGTR
ncbi:MAG: hypothetical protein ACRD5J_14695 [Nitrososphaeraceae archaeon]